MENTTMLNAIPTSARLVMVMILAFCVDFPFLICTSTVVHYTFIRCTTEFIELCCTYR